MTTRQKLDWLSPISLKQQKVDSDESTFLLYIGIGQMAHPYDEYLYFTVNG